MPEQYNDNQCVDNKFIDTEDVIHDIRTGGADGGAGDGIYGGIDGSEPVPIDKVRWMRNLPCGKLDMKGLRTIFYFLFKKIDEICSRTKNIACDYVVEDIATTDTVGYLVRITDEHGNCRTGLINSAPTQTAQCVTTAVRLIADNTSSTVNGITQWLNPNYLTNPNVLRHSSGIQVMFQQVGGQGWVEPVFPDSQTFLASLHLKPSNTGTATVTVIVPQEVTEICFDISGYQTNDAQNFGYVTTPVNDTGFQLRSNNEYGRYVCYDTTTNKTIVFKERSNSTNEVIFHGISSLKYSPVINGTKRNCDGVITYFDKNGKKITDVTEV